MSSVASCSQLPLASRVRKSTAPLMASSGSPPPAAPTGDLPHQLKIADLTRSSTDWQIRGTVISVIPMQVSANGCPYLSFFLEDDSALIRLTAFRDVASLAGEHIIPGVPCVVTSRNGARIKWNDYLEALQIIVSSASALSVRLSPPASPPTPPPPSSQI